MFVKAGVLVLCFVTVLDLLSTGSSAQSADTSPLGPGAGSLASLVRLTRQTSCRYGFRCTDGQCVSLGDACDGEKHCADGSDESARLCRNNKCPTLSFRCAYGACISGDQRCDGRSDCADGSDERDCSAEQPSFHSSCGAKFRCDNGECIEQGKECDGAADCADRSDETTKCRDLIPGCPLRTFRCAYGACVDQAARCNDVEECADASDEKGCGGDNPITSRPPRPPEDPSGGDCVLPVYPSIKYSDTEHSGLRPGSRVRNSGFVLWQCEGDRAIGSRCERGQWTPPIAKCLTLCPPLKSTTLDLVCWSGGVVSCNKRHFPGTTVSYQCKTHYLQPPDDPLINVRCQENGEWTRGLPVCRHSCGKSNFQSGVTLTPQIVNGKPAKSGDFPWQAGLYLLGNDGAWTLSCGGSLITPNSVLTAAHCVTDAYLQGQSPPLHESKIVVALGTINKNWTHPERSEVRRKVSKVFVHEKYWGRYFTYEYDIAVLRWREDVTISSYVMPVCIDVLGTYLPQVTSGTLGYVVGWGFPVNCPSREVCDTTSVLLYSNTTVIDQSTCVQEIRSSNANTLDTITLDKFCTSNISVSVIQKGDSGGGIFFRFDGRFYTYGIISVKYQRNNPANSQPWYSVGAFTNVSNYIDWIKDKNTLRLE